jgi:hypothetical protein
VTRGKNARTVVIVEGRRRNRHFRRVVRMAAGLRETIEARAPRAIDAESRAGLILCWDDQLHEVVEVCDKAFPDAQVIVFCAAPNPAVFEIAATSSRVSSILAWPEGRELPRVWELAYGVRRVIAGAVDEASNREPLRWAGVGGTWYPRTTQDLFATLEDARSLLEGAGLEQRVTRRIMGVAHEMLMNAIYDAPTTNGQPRFAHDRTQQVTLPQAEAPTVVIRTDGLTLSLRVTDPFGGLRREHIYGSVVRGALGQRGGRSDEVIDTSGGGAGLGLHRIVSEASATVFDVVQSRMTSVTSTFDLLLSNRERRKEPNSLLHFHRAVMDE